jgi:hypothetical protein
VWQVFWFLLLLGCVLHFAGSYRDGGSRGINLTPGEEGWLARLCYLLICSATLVGIYGLYIAPLVWNSGPRSSALWFPAMAGGVLFVFLTLSQLQGLFRVGVRKIGWPDRWHYGILGVAAIVVTVFARWVLKLFASSSDFKHEEAFFFAYRSLHLTSGVSPLVPLLILLPVYFAWGRVHLTRVTLRYQRLIEVPALGPAGEEAALKKCCDDIDTAVNEPMTRLHWRTAGAIIVAVAIALYLANALHSLEYQPFEELFTLLLTLAYALLFLTCTRFAVVWHKSRQFLVRLERHPMRSAFRKLPAHKAISPLFQFATAQENAAVLVHIRDRLRKSKKKSLPDLKLTLAICDADREIGCILESPKDAGPLRTAFKTMNETLLKELRGYWANPSGSSGGLWEEVIALQYRDYIEYILHQQRNLLLFAITAFVLTIAALHSYPFQGPGTITTFITLTFIIFAGGVITVLAQAERDPILSSITKTNPGELSRGFFLKITGYLGLPLITVLGSQFPSIGHFLFSWIQPLLEAVK